MNEQKLMNSIIDGLNFGGAVLSNEYRIIKINQQFCELFGQKMTEAEGRKLSEFIPVEMFLAIQGKIVSVTKNGRSAEFDYKYDGKLIRIKIIYSSNDEGGLFVIFAEDITRANNYELERNKLQKLNAATMLLKGIVHDTNNVLGAFMGFFSLMRFQKEKLPESLARYIDSMEENIDKANMLMANLGALCRENEGSQNVFYIIPLIKEVGKSLAKPFPDRDIVIRIDYEDTQLIRCNSIEMHQLITQICNISAKLIKDKGSVMLHCRNMKSEDEAQIAGFDKGIRLDFVFGPTELNHNDCNRSILQKENILELEEANTINDLVTRNNGVIHCTNQENQVTVSLFFRAVEEGITPESVKLSDVKGDGRIFMCVEEGNIKKSLFAEVLRKVGYEVTLIDESSDAHQEYSRKNYDFLIVSYPNKIGKGMRLMKSFMEQYPDLRYLFVTNPVNDSFFEEIEKMGIANFQTIPFSMCKMLTLMKKKIN